MLIRLTNIKIICIIGLDYYRETKINPSSQFQFKNHVCWMKKGYKIKSIYKWTLYWWIIMLMKKTFNSGQAVNFAKNIISKNELEEESTLKKIIESVKDVKLKEQKDWLISTVNVPFTSRTMSIFLNESVK